MQPGETINQAAPPPPEPNPSVPANTDQQWKFKPEDPAPQPSLPDPNTTGEISWTASEFIAHHKGFGWYISLGLGAAVAVLLVYLITDDKIAAGVVLFVSIIFGIMGAREPRTLPYRVDHGGITIGNKFLPYGEFKSFSVMEEGAINSILLLPMKRFMPGVSIYFPPDQEEAIISTLGLYLPHETRQVDMVDRLMSKIRF